MATSVIGVGFLELLVLISGGGGLMGLPPGERDARLIRCAPADSVLYVEWAERSAGKEGAPGIDGLAADPEVRRFLERLDNAIRQTLENEGDPDSPLSPQLVYPLARRALLRPGCLFVSIDAEALKAATEKSPLGTPTWAMAAASATRAALVVNAGKEADAAEDEVRSLLATLAEGEKPDDLKMREVPGTGGVPLIVHRHEEYLVLALGKPAAEAVVAGLSGKGDGLSKHAGLSEGLRRTAVERAGCVSWLDVAGLIERLSDGLGAQGTIIRTMSATVGLDAVKSITSTSGVTGGEIHQKTFVATNGGTEGLLALAGGRPIRRADLAHIPADADLAVALSLSGPKLFAALKGIAKKADPGALKAVESAVQQMETDLGLSLENDVFAGLGDVWTLHDSPDEGGVLFTGAVLSVEVRDRKKAEEVVAKLLGLLREALDGESEESPLRDHEFLGHTVTTVSFPRHGPPVELAVCVTDRHAYVALQPQAVKAHLRFLASGKPGLDSRGAKLLFPEGEVVTTSYVDARTAVRLLSALVPYWSKPLVDRLREQEVEFDQFDIPSAAAYLPHVTPAVSAWMRTPEGLVLESRGGLPVPGGLGPLAGFVMGFARVRTVHEFRQLNGNVAPPVRPAPAVVRPVARPPAVIRLQAVPVPVQAPKAEPKKAEPKKAEPKKAEKAP